MRALTWTKHISEDTSVSDGDIAFMDEWLELASMREGHEELQALRAWFMTKWRRYIFSSERLQEAWLEIRSRLEDVVDFRSGLAALLAA